MREFKITTTSNHTWVNSPSWNELVNNVKQSPTMKYLSASYLEISRNFVIIIPGDMYAGTAE